MNPLNSKPYNFKLFPLTSFIDLSKIYIFAEFKIWRIDDDGAKVALVDADNVSCLQMPGLSFIKNLNVSINQREVYDSNQLYPYKCYLDTELSFPVSVKDSYLSVAGYFRDASNQNDFASSSGGLVKRKGCFSKSKPFQTICRLNADIFNTNRFLINNCEVVQIL